MNDSSRTAFEIRDIGDQTVLHPGAEINENLAVLQRVIRFQRSVHTGHAEELAVRPPESAKPHQGRNHGNPSQPGKPVHQFRGIRQHHAAAHKDQRTGKVEKRVERLPDLPHVTAGNRLIGRNIHFLGIVENAFLKLNILRNINQHGTRTAGRRDIEGFLDRFRQILHMTHKEIVLHAGTGNAHGIALLESIGADEGGANLA